jgi:hypothetical protein
MSAVRA